MISALLLSLIESSFVRIKSSFRLISSYFNNVFSIESNRLCIFASSLSCSLELRFHELLVSCKITDDFDNYDLYGEIMEGDDRENYGDEIKFE